MNNIEYRNTLYEVNEVFGILDKSLVDKLPKDLVEKIAAQKAKKHDFKLDYTKPLKDQKLLKTTRQFLSGLYLTYWAEEQDKIKMRKRMLENERKQYEYFEKNYKESIFNPENAKVTENTTTIPVKDEFAMIEKTEDNFFKKFWTKITSFFNK